MKPKHLINRICSRTVAIVLALTPMCLLKTANTHAEITANGNSADGEVKLTKTLTQAPWAWIFKSKTIGHITFLPDRTAIYRDDTQWAWSWRSVGASAIELTNHDGKKTVLKFNQQMTELSGPDHYGKFVVLRVTRR